MPFITLANLGRAGKEPVLNEEEFLFLANEIVNDFPKLPISVIKDAIMNGIKGRYNEIGFVAINSMTIYGWIEDEIEAYRYHMKFVVNAPAHLKYTDEELARAGVERSLPNKIKHSGI